jgi:acetolactate synthase-1/2/3 large subunit
LSQQQNVTVAAAVAARLRDAGITHVFGYPGGETLDLLDAFRGAGLEFVLTRHEAAASFAALAWGELTGTPGVCLATLGPGATNLVSGVAAAMLERAPMLAITAQLPRARYETTTHQRVELTRLFAPITKASMRLDPGDALRTIERAIRLATTGRPGPVHIEVPSDVPKSPCADTIGAAFFGARSEAGRRLPRPAAAPDSLTPLPQAGLSAVADLVARAARPLMLVGVGARRAGQGPLVALAEAAGLPVVVTPKVKGLMPESHPLFGGVIEMLGTRHLTAWISEADAFVFCGFDAVELDMLWDMDRPAALLDEVVDTDAYYRADVELTGDLEWALAALAGLGPQRLRGDRQESDGARRAALARALLDAKLAGAPAPGMLSPRQIIEAVRAGASDPLALVATDVGAHKMAAGQLWRSELPGCFLMSNGQSSMGYGLPAAMAAKLQQPSRQVAAIVGDGGLGMYLGELETFARLRLAVPIVVMVDGQLTLIRMGQERRGYDRYGVDFGTPDYPSLARSLGGHGAFACDQEAIASEVRAAFGCGTFSLIAAPVDERLYRV